MNRLIPNKEHVLIVALQINILMKIYGVMTVIHHVKLVKIVLTMDVLLVMEIIN